ncbi:MAG: type I glyceraldehyde-3-phosphate dehydrogenase [Bacteroidota bacterium]|nr:type I glyceraldehyde-3-phosphate dehydrogenase [Bacteroidota bacterium]
MAIRVGINGVGRIGKLVFRLLNESEKFELVAVNDPMPPEILKTLLRYDTIHGKFADIEQPNKNLFVVNGKEIALSHEYSPELIPWHKYGVDCVIEASGKFKTRQALERHIQSGAKRVMLSQPSDDDLDSIIVLGVNEETLSPNDRIISNASCTTNCLAPLIKTIDNSFGLQNAFFNTVHPFTNNQSLMDGPHPDPRRSRSAFCNIIPTTSTAVKALKKVMPEMQDRIDGFATRVPVPLGSYIEITAQLDQNVTKEIVNNSFLEASKKFRKGILEYCSDPIVSSDIIGNSNSAIFDSLCTKVLGNNFVQVLAWYDNETAYSNRIVDLIEYWYS